MEWKSKKISEIAKTSAGGTPLKSHKEYYENGNIPWLQSGEVGTKNIQKSKNFITKTGLENSSAKIFPEGTVLIAMYGATAGEVGILKFEAATNQAVCGILPTEQLSPDYIYYFFLYYKKKLIAQAVGNAQPNISQDKIKNTLIPVPSIHEQKRIVAILDKAFAAIDKAKANAEQNLKNARELFESCAQMLFKNGNWKHKSIEEVCDDIFAGGDAPKGNFSPKKNAKYQIPIYANSVKDRGLYGYTDFSRVTTPSLTISARGSGTGHTEIRLERYLPIVRLIVLIPKLPLMNLDFLKYSIDNLEIMRSGSAIPQLTVPMIKKYKIPLPSITEQREIVQQLQALCNQTKKSEEIYKVKINKLEELKTSILQKAFSGELTSASAEVALA